MLGAIVGDVIGSVYEHAGLRTTEFLLFSERSRFTDDTVLTVATAHALLTGVDYGAAYHAFGRRYPHAGYGGRFRDWLRSGNPAPYNSWGNGSAMRVGPVGHAFDTEAVVLHEAAASAEVTHDHPEGVMGAQAVALATFLARRGTAKPEIRDRVEKLTGYDLQRSVAEIRLNYRFEVSCQRSVPEAIVAFLDSESVESAIRLAISLGGDADTQAAITGGIAEAFYGGVPPELADPVLERLPAEFRRVIREFTTTFPLPNAL